MAFLAPAVAIASLIASLAGTALSAKAANDAARAQRRRYMNAARFGEGMASASNRELLRGVMSALERSPVAYGVESELGRAMRSVRLPVSARTAIEARIAGDSGGARTAGRAYEGSVRRIGTIAEAVAREGARVRRDARLAQAFMEAMMAGGIPSGYSLAGDVLSGLGALGQYAAFSGLFGGGRGGGK